MRASSALTVAAAAIPLASAGVIKRANNYENAVYWGANDNERNLGDYCESGQGIDIIILAFLQSFGAETYPNGGFGACSVNADQSFSDECAAVGRDITTCQENGIKVFVSIGGAAADNMWALSSDNDAKGVAYSLWNSYANPSATSNSARPFGDATVDGWDIDLESRGKEGYGSSYKYLGTMINALRDYFPSDSSRTYYIGGAPQCYIDGSTPGGDDNMGLSMQAAQYDYLWIQFYNNNCAANNLFNNTALNTETGDGTYNFGDWPGVLKGGASENAKLLVGLPGAPDAGDIDYYYVHPHNVPSLISQSQGTKNFAGIMIYDAGASDEINYKGNNYAQVVKNALNNA